MSNLLDLKKQAVDQSAHVLIAVAALTPLLAWPCPLTAAWAGMILGVVREISQRGSKTRWSSFRDLLKSPSSLVDVAFWTLGGILALMIAG